MAKPRLFPPLVVWIPQTLPDRTESHAVAAEWGYSGSSMGQDFGPTRRPEPLDLEA